MDLGDLEDDPDIRNAAFRELIFDHGARKPDVWAQAMIDKGEWDGFCSSVGLGSNRCAEWASSS
jgi:hypothetical protein